jgi:hypothetical protein
MTPITGVGKDFQEQGLGLQVGQPSEHEVRLLLLPMDYQPDQGAGRATGWLRLT